jgi:hypothetical protein
MPRLPWIQCQGLASKILSLMQRQLPKDWLARYGYRPVLLETFVETPRHRGTCYQAANWIKVGQTAGRGKKRPTSKPILPIKHLALPPSPILPISPLPLIRLANGAGALNTYP